MCESTRKGTQPDIIWVWENLKLLYDTAVAAVTADSFTSSQKKKREEEEEYRRSAVATVTAAPSKSLEDPFCD